MTSHGPIGRKELLLALLCAVGLVWINAYVCRDLFRNPTAYMNSMHGFWIALAKSGDTGWFHARWWPYWDAGIPFEFTYAPLIPGAMSALAAVFRIPHILALQSITGLVYCLGPLTLFAMAWLLTRALGSAFLAALFYSLTAPTQLIVPDAQFSWSSFWDSRRLYILTVWDDTPHLLALALLPLAILFLLASLEKRRWRYYIPTVVLIALMAAASEFGAIEMAMATLCLLFVFRRADWRRHLALIAGLAAFSYILIAPFLSPSILRAITSASRDGLGPGFSAASFTAAAIAIVGWVILWKGLRRWTSDWTLQFFVLFAYLISSVPIFAAYLHRQFIPQPGRYKPEMELALALLAVFGLRSWVSRINRFLKVPLVILLLVLAARQIVSQRRYAKAIMRSGDQTQTIEYRTATWAEQNLPGVRIMLPGSIAQWANAFTDLSQFSGSSWSRAFNPEQQRALAAVYHGAEAAEQDARVSLDWLKAFGVGAVAVSGPHSQEYWKPYGRPAKFDGLLPVLWREDDVTIYRVPQTSASLAHVVPRSAIVIQEPVEPADLAPLERYGSALEDPHLPVAELRWTSANDMRVSTIATEDEVISIQVSYHPGWRATVNGQALPLRRDGLGLMWLDPHCHGPCQVQLSYDGGWELRLCRYASFAAMSALILLPLLFSRRHKSQTR